MAGGGSQLARGGQKKARIEIIPLIDVIFFLLATFVLYTLSLNRIMSLPVQLPVAQTQQQQQKDDDMAVSYTHLDVYKRQVHTPGPLHRL